MTRSEMLRISKQYADLMYQKEYSNLLGKQNRERQKSQRRQPKAS